MNNQDIYSRLSNMTPRQAVVLRCVLDEGSVERVAERLGCSVGNVKFHMTEVYRVLGISKDSKRSMLELFKLLMDYKPKEATRRAINERLASRHWKRSKVNPEYLSYCYRAPTPEASAE